MLIGAVWCSRALPLRAPQLSDQATPVAPGSPAAGGSPGAPGVIGRLAGIGLMTGSAASNQLGAATTALAFPVLGPGRRGRGAPVDGHRPAADRRPAQVRLVHPRAVAARAGARTDLRHDEPVALHRDRPDRARPGGDARVPRPAVGGPARESPCPRPRLWPARRGCRRRARPAGAVTDYFGIALALLAPPAGPATSS